MICCLNPDCQNPQNPEETEFCKSCGAKLISKLRGRYRVIRPIGQGGMGRTYLAVDEDKLNSYCVIKQFSPRSLSAGGSKRAGSLEKSIELFNQEAMRLHELGEHPQIPTLLAYFEEDGKLYLLQQLIRGHNLWQELVKQGAFSEKQIWELLKDLLPVLKFVHEHHVIHRDIKPTNILRQKQDGKLVLIDFGVAKQLNATALAKPGTKVGTEGYAPMEQIRSGRAYPASDLYSLGVTCIHLMTEVLPDELFDPLTGNWLWRERLKEKGTVISDPLGQIIDKLLKDFVSDRYQSADEVLKDINKVPKIATPLVKAQVTGDESCQIPHNWRCACDLTEHLDKIRDLAISPQGKIFASASGDKTIKLWQLGRGKEMTACFSTLTDHCGSVGAIAISPDGKFLVSGSNDSTIKLWTLARDESGQLVTEKPLQTLAGHSDWVKAIAINPKRNLLATGSNDNTIKLWQFNRESEQLQTTPILTLNGHLNGVNALAFLPQGQIVASGSDDRTVKLWHANSGKLLRTFAKHSNRVNTIAFSPNGKILASGSDDGTIKLWNLLSGKLISTLTEHSDSILAIAFSPDGKTIFSGSRDRTIKVWQVTTGTALSTLKDHGWWVMAIAISSDGKTLVSGSGDHSIKIWRYD